MNRSKLALPAYALRGDLLDRLLTFNAMTASKTSDGFLLESDTMSEEQMRAAVLAARIGERFSPTVGPQETSLERLLA